MIYSDKQLSQKLERVEAVSNARFVEVRARMFPESGATWIEVAGAYAMFDGVDSPCTQTFGLGIFEEITPPDIERLEQFFIERDAPIAHEVSPMTDTSLMLLLNERGYEPIELSSILYQAISVDRNPNLKVNPDIRISVIETGEEPIWAQTSAEAWGAEMEGLGDFMLQFGQISASIVGGFPFLAEIGGRPVGTGMLFMHEGAALLAGASTIVDARGQGVQIALLDARLRFAADQGCTIATMGTQPGSQSQRNAQKNGFNIAYTRTKWQLKARNASR